MIEPQGMAKGGSLEVLLVGVKLWGITQGMPEGGHALGLRWLIARLHKPVRRPNRSFGPKTYLIERGKTKDKYHRYLSKT